MEHHEISASDSLSVSDRVERVVHYATPGGATAGGIAPTGVSVSLSPATAIASAGTLVIGTASEVDTAMPITAAPKAPRREFDVQVTASWLGPRPLTSEEQTVAALLAALCAQYADMRDASPETAVFVGLLVYLLVRDLTARFLKP